MVTPFSPRGATANIDVSGSSQRIAVVTSNAANQVRVMNNGTATAWILFGGAAVDAALASSIPVGPGVTEVFTFQEGTGAIYAAAIAAGSTGKIYFTPGSGV